MKLLQRILINGLLAAVPLGIIGYLLAQAAGIWTASQSDRGASEQGAAITDALAGRLPLVLAICGFFFVALGELLLACWSKPNSPKLCDDQPVALTRTPDASSSSAG